MTKILLSIIIILIILCIWVYYMECNHPSYQEVWIDDIIKIAKTGDLILFKATDNINSSRIFCYYTHIGVIWRDDAEGGRPYIFEAAGTRGMDLYDDENKNGIFLTDLRTRLERYKGKLYYKSLNAPVKEELNKAFIDFVNYAKKNMYYNYDVIWNGIKKGLALENYHTGTNCGEITLLSLINLGIFDKSRYTEQMFHHLFHIANVDVCDNQYTYNEPLKIKISPFK
jgi:hypothetical protein